MLLPEFLENIFIYENKGRKAERKIKKLAGKSLKTPMK